MVEGEVRLGRPVPVALHRRLGNNEQLAVFRAAKPFEERPRIGRDHVHDDRDAHGRPFASRPCRRGPSDAPSPCSPSAVSRAGERQCRRIGFAPRPCGHPAAERPGSTSGCASRRVACAESRAGA